MKKLVMFDMDGILFDSMPNHATAWSKTMHDMGYDFPESVYYENEGRTGSGTIALLLGHPVDNAFCQEVYSRKAAYFDALPKASPMPGALEAVSAVRKLGIPAIVVTGSGQKLLMTRIAENYPGLFNPDWMVCSADVSKGKPDPEPYLLGASKAGIGPRDAVVVENAPLGVRAGHDAGCFVVAVNTGPLTDEALLEQGADVIFHSMSELAGEITAIVSETGKYAKDRTEP